MSTDVSIANLYEGKTVVDPLVLARAGREVVQPHRKVRSEPCSPPALTCFSHAPHSPCSRPAPALTGPRTHRNTIFAAQTRRRKHNRTASEPLLYDLSYYKPLPRSGRCETTHKTLISSVTDLLASARAGRL